MGSFRRLVGLLRGQEDSLTGGPARLPFGGSISIALAEMLGAEPMETLEDVNRVRTQGLSPESLKKLGYKGKYEGRHRRKDV